MIGSNIAKFAQPFAAFPIAPALQYKLSFSLIHYGSFAHRQSVNPVIKPAGRL